ncbi:EF-hand domain-containing protein [Lysobacter sp. CW239]|uniref:EF-hand domain-containing protein n=1 Tax=Lysobacteraceae TaxID=32033 RepID=UPI0006903C35|nr:MULTISPECIES: EF-hand domain-containing protein [Lysobacter]QOD91936.1 EF-hand domain-containing protein [Lysobacter sp. CW239]
MSHKSNKPVFAASAALAGSLILAGSAFAATPLAQGYMLGAQDAAASAEATAEKTAEASCGAKHAAEGRCGSANAGAGKAAHEGKCGEGKCGMAMMDTDQDGKLSPAEFAAAHGGDSSQFAAHDGNGDGFIDADEMDAHHAAMMPAKTDMEGKCGEGKCGSM